MTLKWFRTVDVYLFGFEQSSRFKKSGKRGWFLLVQSAPKRSDTVCSRKMELLFSRRLFNNSVYGVVSFSSTVDSSKSNGFMGKPKGERWPEKAKTTAQNSWCRGYYQYHSIYIILPPQYRSEAPNTKFQNHWSLIRSRIRSKVKNRTQIHI